MIGDVSKENWIKRRADELWEQQGHEKGAEQSCWDEAVAEYEAATAEEKRGPVHPGPNVRSDGHGR